MKSTSEVVRAVQRCLHPGLLKPEHRRRAERVPKERRPLAGHCAVASEAVYFMLGGKRAGWKPATLRVSGDVVHWFLQHKDGRVVDPTAGQFACAVDYSKGRGRGFPTPGAKPSKRARAVIACARASGGA